MPSTIRDLLDIFNLEELEHNLFRGKSPRTGLQRVFGGQVIGQALTAAQRTVDPSRPVHSLHCYFLLGGDPKIPIIYQVERIRDGGSFTTRRVTAIQHGQPIFSMMASFQKEEEGLFHQIGMPEGVPVPESLPSRSELVESAAFVIPESLRAFWRKQTLIDVRPTGLEHYTTRDKLPPSQNIWMRITEPVPAEPALNAALLAYLSDMTLLDVTTYAHGRTLFDPEIQAASLDHAMWFHRPFNLNEWLLYCQDSPSSQGSRGLARGSIFSRDGVLVASVAQEGLMRLRTK